MQLSSALQNHVSFLEHRTLRVCLAFFVFGIMSTITYTISAFLLVSIVIYSLRLVPEEGNSVYHLTLQVFDSL